MQYGQSTANRPYVAFRNSTIPQEFRRVVRAETEEFCAEFENSELGLIAARQFGSPFGSISVASHDHLILGYPAIRQKAAQHVFGGANSEVEQDQASNRRSNR
jgi:hypothetical protein